MLAPRLPPKQRYSGFTLLEVIVAFAVLALVLTVLLQLYAGSMRNTKLAAEYTRASILAETQLARMGIEVPITPGVMTGTFDEHYRWQATGEPVDWLQSTTRELIPVQPYKVTIEVRWGQAGSEHAISLTTVRLVTET